ncbi:hypothetical protein AZF37_04455 [endosymbiont 'TC1' of Trimyema compressum]|uniref:DUF3343 domain-containing protein n=1 Tax=endosymbiont 'TC1' of Trimyema compressum TaxID=243899 RepID=UPI0007F13060|nr:DUF3343 domain-containing protein [endosymbiont 'TC1' of Trimyema compressum]AMP20518.1 hypothetical protein AZF37_04455 [endosymbiont 'TC1' of Trimyema compressum]
MTYIYITFSSTHDALTFENTFKGRFPFRIVPVPREISTSCGIAARLDEKDSKTLEDALKKHPVAYGEIHKITKQKPF